MSQETKNLVNATDSASLETNWTRRANDAGYSDSLSSSTTDNKITKRKRIFFWIATTIIVLWEGVMPLATVAFAPQFVTVGTAALGYPNYFAYALIVCKVLGVFAIAYAKTPLLLREWAYAGLAFNFIFAAISHAAVDQNIGYMIMPLVFLGILAVSYAYKDRARA
jgi:hypothetical protein